jgi:hypothetical protein
VAIGLDPVLFWELTPREIAIIGAGRQERLRLDFNDKMTAAYWGGLVPHLKSPPKLDDLLLKPRVAGKQPWQAIKAGFMAALPPTSGDENGR